MINFYLKLNGVFGNIGLCLQGIPVKLQNVIKYVIKYLKFRVLTVILFACVIGTRIIYERSFLLECRNSPLAQSPLANLPRIPGVTCDFDKSGSSSPKSKKPQSGLVDKPLPQDAKENKVGPKSGSPTRKNLLIDKFVTFE